MNLPAGNAREGLRALQDAANRAVQLLWLDKAPFTEVVTRHFEEVKRNTISSPVLFAAGADEKYPDAGAKWKVHRLSPAERKSYLAKCKTIREKLQVSKGSLSRQERNEMIRSYQKIKQMIRDSSAIQIQAAWRGYQIRRPVASARDAEHSRLVLAQETIRKQRQSYNRPQDIHKMTVEQLHEDKAFLKRLLNGLDKAFKHKNGRLPTKQEKEIYRPIYEEYRAIKEKINSETLKKSTSTSLSEMTIQRLKAEKRALQIQLNKFEKQFRMRHGRKIQYQRDITPVKAEFERYMQLKAQLAAHQHPAASGSSGSKKIDVVTSNSESSPPRVSTNPAVFQLTPLKGTNMVHSQEIGREGSNILASPLGKMGDRHSPLTSPQNIDQEGMQKSDGTWQEKGYTHKNPETKE
mmetsp:Transcript_29060/g.70885  ORF Transcript_29060/g.70885 Transcript_29060/m.70885 type:complete len:407 (-) Transcript_29060:224-1444(-)|eukprot:CAMPEP_0114514336 /NCGR_PEP_ID=MMETSP0109-20121206/16097_1 /TAXON_ID=29199 /ORGANISM="Chlorarachnion reptans, Strain CCCM449" /LENGTH=406 /DNA_ID=CAMNT_0001694365 /DNA_START=237 /DNA_END=1457 /DNA_ORIENTATION=+